ncbi:MAG: hypothetical protein ACQETH_14895 [Candidatus Rifleibacteriota bacterium]
MEKIILGSIFLAFLFAVGCTPVAEELDADLKTVKLLNVKDNTAYYLAVQPAVKEKPNVAQPVKIDIGDKFMYQGTLTLTADEAELKTLETRIKSKFGADCELKQHLTASAKFVLKSGDKKINEFDVLSGNVNLPFQIVAKKGEKAQLGVEVTFKPSGGAAKSSITSTSTTYSSKSTNASKSASFKKTATASVSASDAPQPFTVKRTLDF